MMAITEDQFLRYEKVRLSNVTNMWNISLVSELADLTGDEVLEVIQTYGKLADKYLTGGDDEQSA